MSNTNYDPKISVAKGATEGGIAATVATALGALMLILRANVELPYPPESDAAIVGVLTGIVAGLVKWWRNRAKHA